MPFKDADTARLWRRLHRREVRIEMRDLARAIPLHRRLGIETHVHRQAILADPRIGQWDSVTRVWSFNHLFRDSITLAGA